MSDYYAMCRSNYFKVKDEQGFHKFIDDYGAEIITKSVNGQILFGFITGHELGYIPTRYDEEDDDCISILDEISSYLAEGETAIIMETGNDKAKYLNGLAFAIHSNGECISKSLASDIFKEAGNKFGGNITYCEY
jgi:hypothetical protein